MWPPLVPSRSASADMVREARPSSAIAAMASSSIRSWVTCPSRRRAAPATAAAPRSLAPAPSLCGTAFGIDLNRIPAGVLTWPELVTHLECHSRT
ncbi:hypothetical protein Shyd_74930 [Streptomyces hydrogenans]|uniref:Uncharacterized protein n=1 Tax=Streptomyces hydrogenans TaxID=1873719 RepID=A0ABQ3PMA2_9ACTN|nr:hypothetical protein GCM10018784_05130 [Streptomyces hydrogenans]GHI26122.1 hypothetical protein Shyd_74930 [Streptomyces hydrogenans]